MLLESGAQTRGVGGRRMATEARSLVTPELEARRGIWLRERHSEPVGASAIRRWAIAVYWPEKPPRLYWDEEHARGTRFGGIVAPFEFNAFTWPVERDPADSGLETDALPGLRSMAGGTRDRYGEPMRPGDVIRERARIADWEQRETRLGPTLFIHSETEWTNQRGELVRSRLITSVRY